MLKKFVSRKLLATIAGVVVVALTKLGLPEAAADVAPLVAGLVGVYVLGQSWVDAKEAGKVEPAPIEVDPRRKGELETQPEPWVEN